MKNTLSALLFAISALLPGFAQQRNTPPPPRHDDAQMVQQRTMDMVKRYGLNKTQADRLFALNKKYHHPGMGPGGPGGPKGGQPPKAGQKPPQPRAGNRPPQPPQDGKGPEGPRPEHDMQTYNKELSKIMTAAQYNKYLADEKKHRPQPPRKK